MPILFLLKFYSVDLVSSPLIKAGANRRALGVGVTELSKIAIETKPSNPHKHDCFLHALQL